MSADLGLHNADLPEDVDRSGEVSAIDGLLVINAINSSDGISGDAGSGGAAGEAGGEPNAFIDVNDDQFVSAIDALLVFNFINMNGPPPVAAFVASPVPPAVTEQAPADVACTAADAATPLITQCEVEQLLNRAAAASSSEDAIIAIVDRGGRILGVRVEEGVRQAISAEHTIVFAIDGAVAKARTAAFFANGEILPGEAQLEAGIGPLTSRTVRFISQSTVTQREVESSPTLEDPSVQNPFSDVDPSSTMYGPGWVAPIGLGGHFPPGIQNTPPVDLFAIEHQSRDSLLNPGADGIKGSADDFTLDRRFNVDPAYIPTDAGGNELFIEAPESYGYTSTRVYWSQSRGIATLPGGIPLYKDTDGNGLGDTLVGGIGVFFPGSDGYASHEQNFVPGVGQTELDRLNAPKVIEAEWIAFAAAGGSASAPGGASIGVLGAGGQAVGRVAGYDLPFGRIDLVGITLEIYGPHPTAQDRRTGIQRLLAKGGEVGSGSPLNGQDQIVSPGTGPMGADEFYRDGKRVPSGWLVLPHAGGSLSASDVETIIQQGIDEAELVRAAIRVPLGTRTRMVLAVADTDGEVLGLYRMPDATIFSIDVAVAKARNVAYYADDTAIQPDDLVDDDRLVARGQVTAAQLLASSARTNGVLGDPDLYADPASTNLLADRDKMAFTNRTFRFLAEPRFPSGVEGSLPPIFSILNDIGIQPLTAENEGAPAPASNFLSVLGFDAFHASRNFRDPADLANQNGIVFFPGSTPLYLGGILSGGFGVSGDGVDQDDVVTASGMVGFAPPDALRADRIYYRGVRLPFQKFNRNPHG